jgi:mono/diheme cytochrome c family protein
MQVSKRFFKPAGIAACFAILIQSCSRGPLPVSPLKSANLPAASFEIRTDRDTILKTPAGATIRIAAGTLQPESGITGRIVIREAYDLGQMLRGGLVTMSGSDILSSGGMISIEPGAGTKRELARAIRISIPAPSRRGGMQLWSGKADSSSGKVDWQDPQPLNNDSAAFKTGGALFRANCATCHNPNRDATGPAMGEMVRTYDWAFLRAFTRNPAGMIASGDILANAVFCQWKPTVMTAFPTLSDSELNAIFTFADMSAQPTPELKTDIQASADSCKAYLARRGLSLESKPSTSGPVMAETSLPEPVSDTGAGFATPEGSEESSYEISVRNFGWYNVDALLKDLPGFDNSNVTATFSGARQDGISVYLLMPEDNILLEGGPATGGAGSYAFFRNDGTVPLRRGSKCIAAGIKDSAGQWFFAMKEFTAAASQDIGLELQSLSKDSLDAVLDRLVKNNKTAASRPPHELADPKYPADALRPKNIACDCE